MAQTWGNFERRIAFEDFIDAANANPPRATPFVVTRFLAANATDHTAGINTAIDAAHEAGGGLVVVPWRAGGYTALGLRIRPGVHLLGEGMPRLALPGDAGDTDRLLTCDGVRWDDAEDSPLWLLDGFDLDGQSAIRGAYNNFEQQGSHLITLGGDPAHAGRLRAVVRHCLLRNSTGDGIAVGANVDLAVSDVFTHHCFRGGIDVYGGYSRVRIANTRIRANPADVRAIGFHVEVDDPGYGGSCVTDLDAVNVQVDGAIQVSGPATVPAAGERWATARLTNVIGTSPCTFGGGYFRLRAHGCRFTAGVYSSDVDRVSNPVDFHFVACDFAATEARETGEAIRTLVALHIFWQVAFTGPAPVVRCTGCTFSLDPDVETADTTTAVYAEGVLTSAGARLILEDCEIRTGFDQGVHTDGGARVEIRGGTTDAALPLYATRSTGQDFALVVDGLRLGPNAANFAQLEAAAGTSSIHTQNVVVPAAQAGIASAAGIAGLTITGGRLLLGAGSAPGGTDSALKGDVWQRATPTAAATYQWLATASGIVPASATWKTLTAAGA